MKRLVINILFCSMATIFMVVNVLAADLNKNVSGKVSLRYQANKYILSKHKLAKLGGLRSIHRRILHSKPIMHKRMHKSRFQFAPSRKHNYFQGFYGGIMGGSILYGHYMNLDEVFSSVKHFGSEHYFSYRLGFTGGYNISNQGLIVGIAGDYSFSPISNNELSSNSLEAPNYSFYLDGVDAAEHTLSFDKILSFASSNVVKTHGIGLSKEGFILIREAHFYNHTRSNVKENSPELNSIKAEDANFTDYGGEQLDTKTGTDYHITFGKSVVINKLKHLITLRLRAGLPFANDRALLYVTGGYAGGSYESIYRAQIQYRRGDIVTTTGAIADNDLVSEFNKHGRYKTKNGQTGAQWPYKNGRRPRYFIEKSSGEVTKQYHENRWLNGFTAGAGFEYAINKTISFKLEGLYVLLLNAPAIVQKKMVAVDLISNADLPYKVTNSSYSFVTLRAGINIHF